MHHSWSSSPHSGRQESKCSGLVPSNSSLSPYSFVSDCYVDHTIIASLTSLQYTLTWRFERVGITTQKHSSLQSLDKPLERNPHTSFVSEAEPLRVGEVNCFRVAISNHCHVQWRLYSTVPEVVVRPGTVDTVGDSSEQNDAVVDSLLPPPKIGF